MLPQTRGNTLLEEGRDIDTDIDDTDIDIDAKTDTDHIDDTHIDISSFSTKLDFQRI